MDYQLKENGARNFRILHLEHFAHIYLIYGGKLQKILNIPKKDGGFCTFLEPNMDEGCRIFHRLNENHHRTFFRLTNCIVSCKFFMIKNSNYLIVKLGVCLSSMPCH